MDPETPTHWWGRPAPSLAAKRTIRNRWWRGG